MKTENKKYVLQMLGFVFVTFVALTFLSACADTNEDDQAPTPVAPQGLVMDVTDRFVPSGDMTLEHLRLKKGSVIATQGRDIKITVNYLESDEGKIEALPDGSIAPNGQSGRNGGKIILVAQKASGKLNIQGHGEQGGNGVFGARGQDGKAGAQGTPGDWKFNPKIHPVPIFEGFMALPLRVNPPPCSDSVWSARLAGEPMFVCAVAPGNGKSGGNGIFGDDGQKGGNGGDSANVSVTVSENSEFTVTVDAQAGAGGIGGQGGSGGKGGPGGAPGLRDEACRCGTAAWGAKGTDAPPGRIGADGITGKTIPACIKIGTQYQNCPQG